MFIRSRILPAFLKFTRRTLVAFISSPAAGLTNLYLWLFQVRRRVSFSLISELMGETNIGCKPRSGITQPVLIWTHANNWLSALLCRASFQKRDTSYMISMLKENSFIHVTNTEYVIMHRKRINPIENLWNLSSSKWLKFSMYLDDFFLAKASLCWKNELKSD